MISDRSIEKVFSPHRDESIGSRTSPNGASGAKLQRVLTSVTNERTDRDWITQNSTLCIDPSLKTGIKNLKFTSGTNLCTKKNNENLKFNSGMILCTKKDNKNVKFSSGTILCTKKFEIYFRYDLGSLNR